MRYTKPNTENEAVELINSEKGITRILAGGTDVLVQMKSGIVEPNLIVDIKNIPGTKQVKKIEGGYEIGAAVSGFEFNNNLELKNFAPGIAEAFDWIGSTQIQGRCTLVGNLCNASPAADVVPAMVASNCIANIVGPQGKRQDKVENIPLSPGKNSLRKGEFIKSIFIPPRPEFSSDAYIRFTPRSEMDIAVVSVGIFLTIDKDNVIKSSRVSLGAVAPTVLYISKAEEILNGSKLEENTLNSLAKVCSDSCEPIDDKRGTIEFRTHVAGVLAKRAALVAYKRAGEKL